MCNASAALPFLHLPPPGAACYYSGGELHQPYLSVDDNCGVSNCYDPQSIYKLCF